MNSSVEKSILREELRMFGVVDDELIQQILASLPASDALSSPKEGETPTGETAPARVRIEVGDGNPATPVAVYIRNLEGRVVNIAYARAVDGYEPQHYSRTLQPYERLFVGYHCVTASHSSLCSRYIITSIIDAS